MNFKALLPGILLLFLICSANVAIAKEIKVAKITFAGNKAFSADKLKSIIKAKRKKEFNPRHIKLDQILIANFYLLSGYKNVFVEGSFEKTGHEVHITYKITEGRLYYLKSINIQGNEILSYGNLRRRFAINDGAPFRPTAIEEALNTIERLYADNGKPYVILNDTTLVESDSLIQINIRVNEGRTVYIKYIEYHGLEVVKNFLIGRELTVKKGTIYSLKKLEKSQRNIYSTGLFKSVNFRLSPLNDDATIVQLDWYMVEKKPVWLGLGFGVGYENSDSKGNITTFDFSAESGHRNLFGTARSVSLAFTPSFFYGRTYDTDPGRSFSNPKNEYSFSFVEPWILNTRTPGTLRIAYSTQKPPVSTRPLTNFSGSFVANHSYDNYWALSSGISVERISVSDNAVISVSSTINEDDLTPGEDLIYAFKIDPVKDKRDNVLNPHRGYLTEFRNKFLYSSSRLTVIEKAAQKDTSATTLLFKPIISWSRYQPFSFKRRWILATRIRAGGIFELGDNSNIRLIPQTERFYLGGASSVRGYAEQSIGRQDTLVQDDGALASIPVGGKFSLILNAELRIPIFWLFYGEAFIDAGNLWEEFEDIKDFSLKASTGAGLALITPFGPLRFDYGIKLFPEDGERFGEFHLGIAFAF